MTDAPTPSPSAPAGGWKRDQLVERICIGLFAVYDDLTLEGAEANWRAGMAYGCVGSDGHHSITRDANLIADAIGCPPLPQGDGALREKIARVINPDAWKAARTTDDDANLALLQASLAKAAEILALLPSSEVEGKDGGGAPSRAPDRSEEIADPSALLPCPFCGGDASLVQWRDTENPNATWVECRSCEAMVESVHDDDAEQAKTRAAGRWNRRAVGVDTERTLTRDELRDVAMRHGHFIIPARAGIVFTWTDKDTGEVLGRGELARGNVEPIRPPIPESPQ